MTERSSLWELADGIQMDLRAANSKLTELRSLLSAANIPDHAQKTCPHCGPIPRQFNLTEHIYHSHNGPEPAHWVHKT